LQLGLVKWIRYRLILISKWHYLETLLFIYKYEKLLRGQYAAQQIESVILLKKMSHFLFESLVFTITMRTINDIKLFKYLLKRVYALTFSP